MTQPNQRQTLILMNGDMFNIYVSRRCFVTGESQSGNKVQSQCCKQNHETTHRAVEYHTRKGCSTELPTGLQLISQLVMDGSRTLFNGSKLNLRLQLENVLLKLLLLLFINLLIKRNTSLEIHLLATAIFHWEFAIGTLSPTPSYSLVSSVSNVTPSPTSFQATTVSEFSRTLNASITASKALNELTSQTASFLLDMPVTKTKLAHLQGICDEQWIHDGDLCYRVVTEARKFNYAERFCAISSAHLISIANKDENDKVYNLVEKFIGQPGKIKIWLGMERLSSDSKLHWIDNEPIAYENWAPGEPDQTGACVQMIHKGWWEDTSCEQQLPYICKKDSTASLPYSRTTELGILIGIPLACSAIMLTVVGILLMKSIHDSEGTFYGYGKNRDKDKIHSCLVTMTTSIAHVGALGYINESRSNRSSMQFNASVPSSTHSPLHSRDNSIVEAPEITITPETPEAHRRFEAKVFASSSTSIEQERFQSANSLENLLSRKYIKPKTRRLRSLRKSDAVVSPAGHHGKYTKKDDQFEFYEI